MGNYTKTPWVLDEYDNIVSSEGKIIKIPGVALPSFTNKEIEANRNLVKAAPQMYEALVVAQKAIGEAIQPHLIPGLKKEFDLIEEVLKEARGEL